VWAHDNIFIVATSRKDSLKESGSKVYFMAGHEGISRNTICPSMILMYEKLVRLGMSLDDDGFHISKTSGAIIVRLVRSDKFL
jgi:hypothetical protein